MRQISILLLLLAAVACHADDQNLIGLDGASYTLGDFVGRGQWVMVNLWSPGCPPCVDEVPSLVAFHADNAVNAIVVGIAMDYPGFGRADAASLAAFVASNQINFPVLVADGELAGKFVGEQVDLIPFTLAFNPQGHLVARWHGAITTADINEIIRDFTP